MAQQDNKDESIHAAPGSHVTRVDVSERTLAVISIVFAVAGLITALFAGSVAWWGAREMRQVQIQLMYANAIMLREGLVQPGDMVYGPEGNLEYKQHELKRKP